MLETRKGLESSKELLVTPRPCQEPVPASDSTQDVSVSAESGIVPEACEAVEHAAFRETVVDEVTPEGKLLIEVPDAAVVEEGTDVAPEASPLVAIPLDETAGSEPAEAPVVEEEVAGKFQTPAEVTAPVEASTDMATTITGPVAHESSDRSEAAPVPAPTASEALLSYFLSLAQNF